MRDVIGTRGVKFTVNNGGCAASKAAPTAIMEVLACKRQQQISKIKASSLFPGHHLMDANQFSPQRNARARYDDRAIVAGGDIVAGGEISSVAEYQPMMNLMLGREIEVTQRDEFAEAI